METDTPKSTFSSPRVLTGMVLMCVGLVVALCVLIIFFRGTWYLRLFAALTIGTVVAYLCWLDVQDFSMARRTAAPVPEADVLPVINDPGNKDPIREETPESFTILPGKEPLIVETGPLYSTFTHPKAVTSMLLIGIGLGLALSLLISQFRGQWYMPVAFAAFALATIFLYMYWLDRQDFGDE